MALAHPSSPISPGTCDNEQGTVAMIVEAVLVSLALAVVMFRLFSRIHARKGLMLNDYTMFVGMFIGLVEFGVMVSAKIYGIGNHVSCVELSDLINGLRLWFISQLLVYVAVFFVKLSITLFLLNIGGLGKPIRIALITNIIFLAFAKAAFVIELLLQCRPIAGNWDPMVKATAHCVSPTVMVNLSYTSAVIAVITDFCCIFLPLPMLWDLKISLRTKISIIALMLMGTFAMVCGIARGTQVSKLYDTEDFAWAILPISVWTVAELYVGIITGSLPPCRALFLHLVAKARRTPLPAGGYMFTRPVHRPRRSYMLQSLSFAGKLLPRSRGQPTGSIRFTDESQDSPAPWRDAHKTESQDSQEEISKGGMTKTVTVHLQEAERDSSDC